MRQRNDTGYVRHVSAWPTDEYPDLSPFTVGPGEVVDHPQLLAGFTSLEPPPEPAAEPEALAEAPPEPAVAPRPKKNAAQPAIASGGDSA